MKIFGVRQSLLGDCVGALPVLNVIEKLYPGSYKYWHIARKCSHAAPLFLGHPLIDKIVFSDCDEGFGPRDHEIMKGCDMVINTMPSHPFGENWPNYRNFYEETFVMSGLDLDLYRALPEDEKLPKLYKWFRDEPRVHDRKTVALWGFAGYGKEPRRSASPDWYAKLATRLNQEGVHVVQFGHFNDPKIIVEDKSGNLEYLPRLNEKDFFEQIRTTLSCDFVLGTDSGSGLIFAAYDLLPQLNLIHNHWPNHHDNLFALAPRGKKVTSIFGAGSCDSIETESVINHIKSVI